MQKRANENVVSINTVKSYMDHLTDAFLFSECKRCDVKGNAILTTPINTTARTSGFETPASVSGNKK